MNVYRHPSADASPRTSAPAVLPRVPPGAAISATDRDPSHGRQADSPTQMPAKGWIDVLKRTYRESNEDNLSLVAAGVAFYAFLAFVPLLAALVLTYGLVAEPESVVRHIQDITTVMPADAARIIGDQLLSVTQTAQGKKGFGLVVALFLALYGAMRGATSIVTALNIVYEEKETRGIVKTNLLSFAITVGTVLVGVVAILAVSAMGYVDQLLPTSSPAVHTALRVVFWAAAALAGSGAIAALYRYGPNRDKAKWRWLTPGSIAATLLWLAATVGFGIYVSNFGNYNATYGSLGAVVVLLMWLYLSAYVLLMGAEMNAELEHQTERDTTAGPEKPMGARGAQVADTVAPSA
jgi:membrane protein